MKKLLILHCWFGTPEHNWYPYLKDEMQKKGYEVSVPQLIDKDAPTLESWTNCALEDFTLDGDTTIVGHSLGGVLALKLAEKSTVKIDHLVIVSGWDYWDLTPEHESFLSDRIDHAKIIANCERITVVFGTNDPYVTIAIAEEVAKRLNATLVKIENGGHLQASDGFKEFPLLSELV